MPYTPPQKQGQVPASPDHSTQSTPPPQTPAERPRIPRSTSASYLQRYRRSPSFQTDNAPRAESKDTAAINGDRSSGLAMKPSLRQSPPPVGDSAAMPAGAIISPPDSSQNSDDDEERGRFRELQEAVRRSFTVDRSQSPSQEAESSTRELPVDGSGQDGQDDQHDRHQQPTPPRLSTSARKISHSRSTTEGSIFNQPYELQQPNSDSSDEDSAVSSKPPLLRKKSGELVKPAIRPPSRRKHSSMPGTPTYSKAVHFNDDIEQVRHFLQVDRPIAVSAGTSPVNPYDDATEFPFGFQNSGAFEWEVLLQNFPRETFERSTQAVRLERLFLSPDQKSLIGVAAAANIAFSKHVVARFTFDYWKTTSEVIADYSNDVRQKPRADGYDQFNFSIKLSDQANLESKTLFLCVRYTVNGQDHWDNNSHTNFQVDFAKKPTAQPPQPEKPAPSGLGARPIPRSRHNSSSSQRQRAKPSFDDDFVNSLDRGALPRFRQSQGHKNSLSEETPQRQNPSGQMFGARYDFGASLSAALSQAQAQMNKGDRPAQPKPAPKHGPPPPNGAASLARHGIAAPSNSGTESPRPDALLANKQSLDSRAYQDFVSKYCFFGSNKPNSGASRSAPSGGDGTDESSPLATPDGSEHAPSILVQTGGDFGLHAATPNGSGASSPLPVTGTPLGADAPSPGFGYPFHQDSHQSQATTAIRG